MHITYILYMPYIYVYVLASWMFRKKRSPHLHWATAQVNLRLHLAKSSELGRRWEFAQTTTCWLVVEPTHFEKYAEVKLDHFPKVRGEHKKYLKPPVYLAILCDLFGMVKWPFEMVKSDLQRSGIKKSHGLNHLGVNLNVQNKIMARINHSMS